ncbi:MAG: glycine cleavage system protein GcvH [Candidatus Micrarchaeota archaeon]
MTNIPKDRMYTKEHEWIKIEGEFGIIGITDYAQHALTDIVFVELPQKGKLVEQATRVTVVESVKSVSDIYAPMSGEIVEVNEALGRTPENINQDPYGNGWIVKIKLSSMDQSKTLLDPEQYEQYLKENQH